MKTQISFLTVLMVATSLNLSAQNASQSSIFTPPPAVHSPTTIAAADCDYNTCALRMKLTGGSWRIIRGEQEQRAATIGMFRAPNIESIVAASPEAVAEVRTFRKNYTSGELLQVIGVVLMGVGLGATSATDDTALLPLTAVAGGGALLLSGVCRHVRAFNALHKGIWLYNRSLKR